MGKEFAAGFVAVSCEPGQVVDVLVHGAVVGDLVAVVVDYDAGRGISFFGRDDGGNVLCRHDVFLAFFVMTMVEIIFLKI